MKESGVIPILHVRKQRGLVYTGMLCSCVVSQYTAVIMLLELPGLNSPLS